MADIYYKNVNLGFKGSGFSVQGCKILNSCVTAIQGPEPGPQNGLYCLQILCITHNFENS